MFLKVIVFISLWFVNIIHVSTQWLWIIYRSRVRLKNKTKQKQFSFKVDYHSWNPGIDLSSFFAFSLFLGMKTKKSGGSHQQDKHNNGSETSGPPQPATSSTQVCWTFQFNFNLKKNYYWFTGFNYISSGIWHILRFLILQDLIKIFKTEISSSVQFGF